MVKNTFNATSLSPSYYSHTSQEYLSLEGDHRRKLVVHAIPTKKAGEETTEGEEVREGGGEIREGGELGGGEVGKEGEVEDDGEKEETDIGVPILPPVSVIMYMYTSMYEIVCACVCAGYSDIGCGIIQDRPPSVSSCYLTNSNNSLKKRLTIATIVNSFIV